MLPIVIALSAASPIVLKHPLVITVRFWVSTVFRLALSLVVGALVYFAVLFAVVELYPLSQPLGAVIYGVSFALATLLSVVAGTLVSPLRLSRSVTPSICLLAVMFPIGLYVYFGFIDAWRAIYLLYLLGTIAGGYCVMHLTYGARNFTLLSRSGVFAGLPIGAR